MRIGSRRATDIHDRAGGDGLQWPSYFGTS